MECRKVYILRLLREASKIGLERIHQVTNTIRITNTGWRIRIYVFANTVIRCIHSRILLTECASEEDEVKNVYSANTCGLHYT